jgi:hypothetical protein
VRLLVALQDLHAKLRNVVPCAAMHSSIAP